MSGNEARNRGLLRALRPVRLLLAGLVFTPAGCVALDQSLPSPPPAAAVQQVKVGGDGVRLGDAQQAGLPRDVFLRRLGELVAAHQFVTAQRWVERYPDVALEVLRGVTAPQAGDPLLQGLAKTYEEQCCGAGAVPGWVALLQERAAHPDRYQAYDAARQEVVGHLHNGRFKEAAEVRLPALAKGAPCVVLEVDALQLSGEALLLADRPQDAAACFAEALKLACPAYPHQGVHLLLSLSEAQRRCGNAGPADATWKDATELAASLLTPERPVADPAQWERIAYLRPVRSDWPAVVGQQFDHGRDETLRLIAAASAGPGPVSEALPWAAVGQWRLHRNEPQAALLAFKHAETFATDPVCRDRLQLGEARALAQLDQRASALAILNHLADHPTADVAQPALALLGALLFKEGQNPQSLALLRKALGKDANPVWPGRAEALADLGLACLTAGEDLAGLAYLHAAQQQFEATRDHELLQQCLWNEAAYLEHQARKNEADSVRERARRLEGAAERSPNHLDTLSMRSN